MKYGDQNTKYFHYKASARRKKNEIKSLLDDAGFWQDNENVVQTMICKYFSKLYTSTQPEVEFIDDILEVVETKISREVNSQLLVEFTSEDVCKAVKEMYPIRAPGVDGLPSLFCQKFWGIVKNEVISVCPNVLDNNDTVDCLNEILIILISKKDNPTRVDDYRPINLCNVIYKTISKCLANRLKVTMHIAITDTQSAFVEGRVIYDNVIIDFE